MALVPVAVLAVHLFQVGLPAPNPNRAGRIPDAEEKMRSAAEEQNHRTLAARDGAKLTGYELSLQIAFEKDVTKFVKTTSQLPMPEVAATPEARKLFRELEKQAGAIIRGIKDGFPGIDTGETEALLTMTFAELIARVSRLNPMLPSLVKSRRDGVINLREARGAFEHLRAIQLLSKELAKGR